MNQVHCILAAELVPEAIARKHQKAVFSSEGCDRHFWLSCEAAALQISVSKGPAQIPGLHMATNSIQLLLLWREGLTMADILAAGSLCGTRQTACCLTAKMDCQVAEAIPNRHSLSTSYHVTSGQGCHALTW